LEDIFMKKFLLIGLIVGLVLIIVGGVGVVFGQAQGNAENNAVTVTQGQNGDKGAQQYGYGRNGSQGGDNIVIGPGGKGIDNGILIGPGRGGMMDRNGQGYEPGGMMDGRGVDQYNGVMQDYLISAFASAVGLTVDQVNTRLANGETPAQIAVAQGKNQADLPALWSQVHQDALNKAVTAGVITQEQANAMQQRMNNYSGPGFGPGFGSCPMWNGDKTQP
jgi:hypothetical protein